MGFGVVAGSFNERHRGILSASEASFIFETCEHYLPTFVHLADAPIVANADIVIKSGVGTFGADCPDGLNLNTGGGEGHDEHGEAAMFRGFRVGAGE